MQVTAGSTIQPRVAVVTVSDGVAAGTRTDVSGAAIASWIEARGSTMAAHHVVADAADAITALLLSLADRDDVDVILTTGGTGLTERDVTPEATRAVLERDVPGIPEKLRAVADQSARSSAHQQSASTWSTFIRSASSTRRALPGKSTVRKSVRMPKAKTSSCSSSTILANCSTWTTE